MKNILVITSHFYPEQTIAAIRLEKRIKALVGNNYNVYVLTNGDVTDPRWGEKEVYRVNKSNTIKSEERVSSFSGSLKGYLLSKGYLNNRIRALKKIKNGYDSKVWYKKNIELASKIVREKEIDIIYSTVPKLETLMIGNYLKNKFENVKYVVEFRDILADNLAEKNPLIVNNIMKRHEKDMESLVDGFIFLTEGLYEHYANRYKIEKYKVVYNGYRKVNLDETDNNEANIIFSHIGSLYGSRSPNEFIFALGELLNENKFKGYKDKIKINFVGDIASDILYEMKNIISAYNLEGVINFTGMINNEKAVDIMFKSDINILITHDEGSEYAIPGKLFEYIGARNKILALTQDPIVKDMIESNNFGTVIKNNKHEIIEFLRNYLECDENNGKIDLNVAEKFSQEYQEERFIEFIDGVSKNGN
ncbi:hypothetical protein [Clostridium sp. LP20]|uniref:hypothetical protein n=1 Tax=Clostridium sp. LP20 TaxID=3418665 RepID=UPI003EE6DA1D